MANVAFLGLGVMGFPMAGHLAAAGHDVTVYNRNPARAERWIASHAGGLAISPRLAVASADVVFVCVGDDPDVRQVIAGDEGALAGMKTQAVLVDHTTTSANLARELASLAAQAGIGFLDAPVSGGQAGAESGQLTIMAGGAPEAFAAAEPVMAAYARQSRLIGPSGHGQLAKMVNQICIAGVLQGLAEGLHFANQAGLDTEAVIDVISKGAAQSWQMEHRARTMLQGEYDFGFAVDWMRKDLGHTLAEARRNGSTLSLTALVDQFYGDVQRLGGQRWDTSSLLARLK